MTYNKYHETEPDYARHDPHDISTPHRWLYGV
jgi:hypothetical protein